MSNSWRKMGVPVEGKAASGKKGIPIRPRWQLPHTRLEAAATTDSYERKADRVADQLMRMPESVAGARRASAAPIANHARLIGGAGRPIESGTRRFFEDRLGTRLDHVRVQTDHSAAASAEALNA